MKFTFSSHQNEAFRRQDNVYFTKLAVLSILDPTLQFLHTKFLRESD